MGVRAAGGSASMTWPARDIAETLAILTAPGAPFEMAEVEIGGRRLRSYVRMPQNLRSLFDASRRFGARDLLGYEEERVTFEAHLRAASPFGSALSDRLGVGQGGRGALALTTLPEWSLLPRGGP